MYTYQNIVLRYLNGQRTNHKKIQPDQMILKVGTKDLIWGIVIPLTGLEYTMLRVH